MTSQKVPEVINVKTIMEILPHRYPFLLVDRVLELKPGEKILALKNVSINEPFFQGHFPGEPVMPGVLILEALAQAGGIMLYYSEEDPKPGEIIFLAGFEKVRFRRPVTPGDQLMLEVSFQRKMGPIFKVSGKATVEGQVVAEAGISASKIPDKKEDKNDS
jgi:3-hydroxyacyl-[acyl-carrier-protein] dehydratase